MAAGPAGLSRAQLLDPVLQQGGGDRGLVRLAVQERLGELLRLRVLDLAGQRRLLGVDVDVDQSGPVVTERLAERVRQVARAVPP